ncbi:MAG: hypothetical protein ACI9C1_001804 [Candidatus Aldehydirespiratoraceae bacterium]|jgi:hypothetical protein
MDSRSSRIGVAILSLALLAASCSDDDQQTAAPSIEVQDGAFDGGVDVTVWFAVDATAAEIAVVKTLVTESDLLGQIAFFDHDAAFAEFADLAPSPEIAAAVEPETLPQSFRLAVAAGVTLDLAADLLAGLDDSPGVDRVITADRLRGASGIPGAEVRELLPVNVSDFDLIVVVAPEATVDELAEITRRAETINEIASFDFVDQTMLYDEFVEAFASTPEVSAVVTPEEMPLHYRLTLTLRSNDVLAVGIAGQFEGLAGVRDVISVASE